MVACFQFTGGLFRFVFRFEMLTYHNPIRSDETIVVPWLQSDKQKAHEKPNENPMTVLSN